MQFTTAPHFSWVRKAWQRRTAKCKFVAVRYPVSAGSANRYNVATRSLRCAMSSRRRCCGVRASSSESSFACDFGFPFLAAPGDTGWLSRACRFEDTAFRLLCGDLERFAGFPYALARRCPLPSVLRVLPVPVLDVWGTWGIALQRLDDVRRRCTSCGCCSWWPFCGGLTSLCGRCCERDESGRIPASGTGGGLWGGVLELLLGVESPHWPPRVASSNPSGTIIVPPHASRWCSTRPSAHTTW